ncbi:hypothetical protein QJS04_geneDACA009729 [Acorus gramineus]|uniref:MATH domain-containing protein n=1 Tax=Acorus gramineus TaxID=55184 RepID=A0AAV9B7F8_ACOGR|nr:hypothetical protein QJS04_geneDACA009729 [Acorus gramineus]
MKSKTKCLRSGQFEVSGFKWAVYMEPNYKMNGKGYVHVGLAIQEIISPQRPDAITEARYKLHIMDQVHGRHLTFVEVVHVTGGSSKWFHQKVFAHRIFSSSFSRYCVKDVCVFAIEVLKLPPSGFTVSPPISPSRESLFLLKEPSFHAYTWKINQTHLTSMRPNRFIFFFAGGRLWFISFHFVKGTEAGINFFALDFGLFKSITDQPNQGLDVGFTLRMINQIHSDHREARGIS